jgi:heme exporter protein D
MNWFEFFPMGGYAVYVWGAYGLVLAAMAGEVLLLLRRRNALRSQIRRFRNSNRVEL